MSFSPVRVCSPLIFNISNCINFYVFYKKSSSTLSTMIQANNKTNLFIMTPLVADLDALIAFINQFKFEKIKPKKPLSVSVGSGNFSSGVFSVASRLSSAQSAIFLSDASF